MVLSKKTHTRLVPFPNIQNGTSEIEPLGAAVFLKPRSIRSSKWTAFPTALPATKRPSLSKSSAPALTPAFVNAILRNTVRKKTSLHTELQALTGISGVSIRHSIPLWICQKWESDYGQGSAEQIAHGFEGIPPHLTLHINTLKTTADDYLAKLDPSLCPRKIGDSLITLSGSAPVESLPGFDEGLFFIQDESSALCAAPCQRVGRRNFRADRHRYLCLPRRQNLCLAIANADCGTLYSFDLHANRLSLMTQEQNA